MILFPARVLPHGRNTPHQGQPNRPKPYPVKDRGRMEEVTAGGYKARTIKAKAR